MVEDFREGAGVSRHAAAVVQVARMCRRDAKKRLSFLMEPPSATGACFVYRWKAAVCFCLFVYLHDCDLRANKSRCEL